MDDMIVKIAGWVRALYKKGGSAFLDDVLEMEIPEKFDIEP